MDASAIKPYSAKMKNIQRFSRYNHNQNKQIPYKVATLQLRGQHKVSITKELMETGDEITIKDVKK